MQFKDPTKRQVVATLGFLTEDDRILLGMKKRGFGEGRWNGFGGKLEPGETLEQALIREFAEECEVAVRNPRKCAELYFDLGMEEFNLIGHIYMMDEYDGAPCETEEMRPRWFHRDELPYDEMWVDDKLWVPQVLRGEKIRAYFNFSDHDTITEHYLESL